MDSDIAFLSLVDLEGGLSVLSKRKYYLATIIVKMLSDGRQTMTDRKWAGFHAGRKSISSCWRQATRGTALVLVLLP